MNLESTAEQSKRTLSLFLFDDEIREHHRQQQGDILRSVEIPASYRKPTSIHSDLPRVVEHTATDILNQPKHHAWGSTGDGEFAPQRSASMFVPELKVPFTIKQATQISECHWISGNPDSSTAQAMGSDSDSGRCKGSLNRGMAYPIFPRNIRHVHAIPVGTDDIGRYCVMQGPAPSGTHGYPRRFEPIANGRWRRIVDSCQFRCGLTSEVVCHKFLCRDLKSFAAHLIAPLPKVYHA